MTVNGVIMARLADVPASVAVDTTNGDVLLRVPDATYDVAAPKSVTVLIDHDHSSPHRLAVDGGGQVTIEPFRGPSR